MKVLFEKKKYFCFKTRSKEGLDLVFKKIVHLRQKLVRFDLRPYVPSLGPTLATGHGQQG